MSSEKVSQIESPDHGANYGIDYVIHYIAPQEERSEAEAAYVQLIEALTAVGLATEVRPGADGTLLVFVKVASEKLLSDQVYRSRLQDWLHGVRTTGPGKDASQALLDEPVTEAERLRLVYLMITKPKNEGGAGITPKSGHWKYVDSVFPLHDRAFNTAWIKKWSTKYLLGREDLDEIRDKFGESVAFYFAFTQSYFRFLLFPAALGFGAWLLLGQFSFLYALANCLWSVVFFEFWKKKEADLAIQWGARGISSVQHPRPQFEFEREAEDPVTGEPIRIYSPYKRLQTQLLQIPFAVACALVLGGFIVICNSLEIFINEVYGGPFKQFLPFLPTILLVTVLPIFSTILTKYAEKLTEWENYETIDGHNAAFVQKQFVVNFITSYMPLFFTAFVYIPFSDTLSPFLNFWRAAAVTIARADKGITTRALQADPSRISKQMFFSTITAQIISFATEVVVPYAKRKAMRTVKETRNSMNKKQGELAPQDHAEEAAFMERVRNEVELETYDVTVDYREMIIQFGYLSMFSVAWPLAACAFLVNNWVELRSDAVKIAHGSRRPIPWRADSIGPWLDALGFLSWLGSLTSSAIIFLCTGDNLRSGSGGIQAWRVLLGVLVAEHFYLAVQFVVRYVMAQTDSPGHQKVRKERYLMKKRMLQETLGQDATGISGTPGVSAGEKLTRQALEDQARRASVRGLDNAPEEMFWQRQRGMADTIEVGRSLLSQTAGNTTVKA